MPLIMKYTWILVFVLERNKNEVQVFESQKVMIWTLSTVRLSTLLAFWIVCAFNLEL